ncbi:transcription factor-like protein DPB isoform X2 [Ipomoea triloba]|uniref:transcription factor-like protein DPB isoform X2 n=1 Tax=Ipomoea triloba TaxID=35885 RepID=UPI00125DA13B|nr:transcription factor-like protein DPB isoform X2 [Ipomoea triloba]
MDGKILMQHSKGQYPFLDAVCYADNNEDIDPSGPNSVEKTKRGSKVVGGGLRQYSNMVCMKVKDKGRTTYSEVADEIIADFRATEVNSSVSMNESDEKNIRRRVYDVLNVLMALDIVTKDRKEIQWKGLPTSAGVDMDEIKGMRAKLKDEINKKAAYLKDLEDQIAGHQALICRNQQLYDSKNGPPKGFPLPFLVVKLRLRFLRICSWSTSTSTAHLSLCTMMLTF